MALFSRIIPPGIHRAPPYKYVCVCVCARARARACVYDIYVYIGGMQGTKKTASGM